MLTFLLSHTKYEQMYVDKVAWASVQCDYKSPPSHTTGAERIDRSHGVGVGTSVLWDNRRRSVKSRSYIAIDLKSFYASVECVERGLDPMTTNLVVADIGRTEKTICLAVSPSLKAYGIPGRARLFEVVQKVREVNAARQRSAPRRAFTGGSSSDPELKSSPNIALDYIVAPPKMALYIEYSTRIYNIYLKYIAPEDIHVYS